MARMLLEENMTVTVCHSRTSQEDMRILLTIADLVICAVGKPEFLDCNRTTAPVIDVGINFNENGKLVGDCYNTEGRDVTPVPGGVGLLTRLALLENVVMAAEIKEERENATK
jgi:methylenetetrahydrofolate dehydrogenase (NADP+)/methenyltetrahydrofolate cyclohydrolase